MPSSSLDAVFTESVTLLKARRSRKTVKNGLQNLVEMDFSAEMAIEVDLKTVIRNIFTYDPFEEMKDTLIAKVELLEAAYEKEAEKKVMKSIEPAKESLMPLPAASVMPVPLMSLQVERPTWLSRKNRTFRNKIDCRPVHKVPEPYCEVQIHREFVEIFQTLRSLDEIKQGYKTLIKTDFPAELVQEFNLFEVVRKVPTWPPFEKLKDKLLAKIEELEKVNEMKAEKKDEPDTKETSRFEKKPVVKKEEKPKKRAAEALGSMEPPAKRPVPMPIISSSSRPDNWVPKKRTRPSQARQPQKTIEAVNDHPKALPTAPGKPAAPIVGPSLSQGFRIPKKKVVPAGPVEKPAEVVKDAPKPVPTAPVMPAAPIVGSSLSQGFRIPKREIVPAGSVEKPHEPAKDAPKPIPVPLLSLKVEKPAWLSDAVFGQYKFSH
ncbi:unnamed protein product [Caenorhabditis brenneri]